MENHTVRRSVRMTPVSLKPNVCVWQLTADWQGSLTAAISTSLNTPDNLTHTHPCLLPETNFRWRCFEKTAVCILYVDPPICVGWCGRDSASFLCQTQLCQTHVGRMRFCDKTAVLIWVTHFSQTLLGCAGLVCVRRGFVTKAWCYCISFPKYCNSGFSSYKRHS